MNSQFEQALHRASFIRLVPEQDYARVRDRFEEVRYAFGDVIFREGEEVDAFYVLVSGRVRVLKEKADGEELTLQRLEPGDAFGEALLYAGGRRAEATVRCTTAVEVLRLGRTDFDRLLREFPEVRGALEVLAQRRTLRAFLRERSRFGSLPEPALDALMGRLQETHFGKGQMIFQEAEPANSVYMVLKGRVRLFLNGGGQDRNIAFCREGDILGEARMVTGARHSANAQAVTSCTLLTLPGQAIEELAGDYPQLSGLLEERRAPGSGDQPPRVPLDFAPHLSPGELAEEDEAAPTPDASEPRLGLFEENGHWAKRPGRIRRVPFVWQIDEMDCGAASLAMVCRHFGRKVSLAHIRRLCHSGPDGISLQGICHAATELGLAARPLKVSKRNLPEVPMPAIVHWEGNHWLVLFDVSEDSVRVADPALGIRKLSRQEFERRWSGYAALFDYTEGFEQAPKERRILAWLRPFVEPLRGVLLQALGLAALASALQLLFPIFTQMVVDKVMVDRDLGLLRIVLLAMGVALVFLTLSTIIQQYLLSFMTVRVDASVLDFLTRRLLALPMSYFHRRRTGDIQRRLDAAQQIRQFLVQRGLGGLLGMAELVGCVVLMGLYSPPLLALFFLVMPLYAGLMLFSFKVLRPLYAQIEESQGRYHSHQIDAIRGIEAVKAAAAELTFRDHMLREFLLVSRKMFRANFVVMAYGSVLQAIGMLSTMLFLFVGAHLVIEGRLSIGVFVAFSSLMAMASAAILSTLGLWDELQLVSVLLNRLDDILTEKPEQGEDRSRLLPVRSLEGQLEVRRLTFRYGGPDTSEVLQGVSLVIPAGRTVAIVGRSGSGKTTLAKLLAGLMEPTTGTILYDQVELSTLNYRELRRHIGLVLQDNHLFDLTVRENIAFGDPEPNLDRAMWAAQVANAHEFVTRLPLGYETRIGETGLALSGGQKQRVAIARALYNDPAVLIFDEATSALDSESERAIQSNLAQLVTGRTCVVIAHRLSTIRNADMIVVLEQGRIVETGTHDELMARHGLYFFLSSQQLGT